MRYLGRVGRVLGHATDCVLRRVLGGVSSAILVRCACWAWSWLVAFVCFCVSVVLVAGVGVPSARALDYGGLSAPGSLTVHRLLTAGGQDLGPGDGVVSEDIDILHDARPAVGEGFSLYRLDVARVEGAVEGVGALSASMVSGAASEDAGTGSTTALLELVAKYAGVSATEALVGSGVTDADGEIKFSNLAFAYYLLVADPMTALGSSPVAPCVVAMPYAGVNGSYVKDVHVYPKTGLDTSITKSVATPKRVVGLGDKVVWNVDFPVPSELKQTINGQVVYGSDWYVYDDIDSRLDVEGMSSAAVGRGSAWTMSVLDAKGNESKVQPASGDGDVKASWDEQSRRITWSFTDEFVRRVCDEASAVSVRVVLTSTVNQSAMQDMSTVFNDAVISFTKANGDPFWHRVIARSSNSRSSSKTVNNTANNTANTTAASAALSVTASTVAADTTATTTVDSGVSTVDSGVSVVADTDGGTAYGDEDNPLHPRVYIGAISVTNLLQGTSTPLPGAKFALASSEKDAKAGQFMTRDGAVFERESDENGKLTFEAVGEGEYWLVETQTPQCPTDSGKEECARLVQPVKVTVGNDKASSHPKVQIDHHVKTVIDEIIDKGSSIADKLANTGLSTRVTFTIGVMALAFAVVIIVRRRRRDASNVDAQNYATATATAAATTTATATATGVVGSLDSSLAMAQNGAPLAVVSATAMASTGSQLEEGAE